MRRAIWNSNFGLSLKNTSPCSFVIIQRPLTAGDFDAASGVEPATSNGHAPSATYSSLRAIDAGRAVMTPATLRAVADSRPASGKKSTPLRHLRPRVQDCRQAQGSLVPARAFLMSAETPMPIQTT